MSGGLSVASRLCDEAKPDNPGKPAGVDEGCERIGGRASGRVHAQGHKATSGGVQRARCQTCQLTPVHDATRCRLWHGAKFRAESPSAEVECIADIAGDTFLARNFLRSLFSTRSVENRTWEKYGKIARMTNSDIQAHRRMSATAVIGLMSGTPLYNLKRFSALPCAMRSLSAALTGSCSRNARPSGID